MNIITNTREQISWISSLRGLLVLLVFISHLNIPIVSKDFLFILGRIGVVGFFLISGFLAVNSIEKRNVKQFYLNRFFRIYPIYWLLLIILFGLSGENEVIELLFNMTLFEEFVGYNAMIGSSWMLPIMVLFFAMLPFTIKNYKERKIKYAWVILCFLCLSTAILRYFTGKHFPTALCLLILVGLLGVMEKKDSKLGLKFLASYELLLVLSTYLSYGSQAICYFIAYNLGFLVFFLFKYKKMDIFIFKIIGEQGFTFFLGAAIPMMLLVKIIPGIDSLAWFPYISLQFVLAFIFAYIVTRLCEKPLLKMGKRWEAKLCNE